MSNPELDCGVDGASADPAMNSPCLELDCGVDGASTRVDLGSTAAERDENLPKLNVVSSDTALGLAVHMQASDGVKIDAENAITCDKFYSGKKRTKLSHPPSPDRPMTFLHGNDGSRAKRKAGKPTRYNC